MAIKTLIFDWGGVLTKSPIGRAVYKTLLEDTNCKNPMTVEQFYNILEAIDTVYDYSEFVNQVNEGFQCSLDLEEIEELFEKTIVYLPNVLDFAKSLKGKYRLILFSNNHRINIDNMKKYHQEIFEIFENIYFSCNHKIKKPNLDFYKLPINELNLVPEECVFIDDKIENIEAGNKVGFNGILHTDLENLKQELKKLDVDF